jgi:hypothetical protein
MYELHVAVAVIAEKSEVRKVQVDELVCPDTHRIRFNLVLVGGRDAANTR